ncbi:MAG: transposase [Magnetococcus sp. YQC-3]
MLTYKFRIYPTKEQQDILWEHSKLCNQLYNTFLDYKIENYTINKKNISKYDTLNLLPELKNNVPLLKTIHSQVLQQVLIRLDNSYKNFFNRVKKGEVPGFPKFRSSKYFFTLTYPQSGYKFSNNYFITKSYGKIKINLHRKINGDPKDITNVSITRDIGNKWYLCIGTDNNIVNNNIKEDIVGLDVGIKNIAALSTGKIIENKDYMKYYNKIIDSTKSYRDKRCKKGSRKYKSLSSKIRRLYGVRDRKVNDFLHKVSKELSSRFDTIVVEDLPLKKMSEGKITSLNKNLREASIGKFISFLEYKTNNLIKVNPYNTSKTCSNCGKIHNIDLSVRTLNCDCGLILDRDVNAAVNILGKELASWNINKTVMLF